MVVTAGDTDCEPEVVLVPDQSALAVQLVALVEDQVRVELGGGTVSVIVIEVGVAVKVTVGRGRGGV